MNVKHIFKKYFYPVTLILLSVLVYWRWVFLNEIFTYGDWGFFYEKSLSDFYTIPQIWSNYGLGSLNISTSSSLIYFLLGFFEKFSEFKIIIKFFYFFPIVFILPITSHALFNYLIKHSPSAFISSLFFIFNTYFLIGVTGHLTLMAAFSFAPILLKYYIEFSSKPNYLHSIKLALLSTLIIGYEARAAYIVILLLFIYFLMTFIKNSLDYKFRYFFYNSIYGVFLILLNIYWVLPMFFVGSLSTNDVFSRGLFGDGFLNISNAITTYHPFWSFKGITIFTIQSIPIYYYVFPFMMFYGFYLYKKDKNVQYFFLLALIGIFLTKQSAEPFGFLYNFLYNNFPGFNAFREASKFFFISSLSYGVLIGFLYKYLYTSKIKIYNLFSIIIFIFISILTIINTKMFIDGRAGTLFIPRNIPESYINFKDILENQDGYYRTLWLPTDSRWSYYTNSKPKINGSTFVNHNINLIPDNNIYVSNEFYLLKQEFSLDLLNKLNIKYIVVPILDKENDDNFWVYHGYNRNSNIREYYLAELSKLPYLNKINNIDDLYIFENINYNSIISVSDNIDYDFKKIGNSKYIINIKNFNTDTFELYFSQSYHPDWVISYYNNENLLTYNSNNYLKSVQTVYGTNKFIITPDICEPNCRDNLKLIIHFNPQYYLNIGLLISITSFLFIIITYPFISLFSKRRLF